MSADEKLQPERILQAMSPSTRDRIGALEVRDDIDSTNAELLRRGHTQTTGSVLLAEAQSAGRGRRGRTWASPPGANLYFSLYWRFAAGPRALGGLSLAIGVACAEALRAIGAAAVGVKWPNDLVAHGRKLGGLLIELAHDAAVIGVGVNVRMPQAAAAGIDQPWIDLAELDCDVSRNRLAARLIDEIVAALIQFEANGFDAFVERWDALDALAGRRVLVQAGEREHRGVAQGVAPDGGLRVLLDQGLRVFHSADVSLRPA